jgi:DNA repair exonuclease SbcCD ATPase subunit
MAKNVQLTVDIKGGDSVGKAAEKTKTLKTQLRELKAELASGSLTGKAFDEAAERAGKLEDAIKDVNQRVNNLSSDTQKLDGFLDLATGITGGFAAAQGAMALFGSENEDLQKQLVKIQGAVALLNGVQQVANTLNKDSAAMTQLNIVRTKIMTFVQGRYAAVVGTTTGAMKLLRLAGAAIPITLLITGLGILIANFDKIKKAVLNFIPALANIGDLFTKVKNAVMDFVGISSEAERAIDAQAKANEKSSKQIDRQIALLEAQGGKEREIFDLRYKQLRQDADLLEMKKKKKLASQEEIDQLDDLRNAILVLNQEETNRQNEVVKNEQKKNDEVAKKRKEAHDKRVEQEKKDAEEIKKLIADETEKQRERDFSEQAKEIDALQDAAKEKMLIAKGNAEAEKLILENLSKDVAAINDKYRLQEEEKNKELKAKKDEQDLADIEAERVRIQELADFDLQTKQNLEDAKLGIANQSAQFLQQIAGKQKGIALAALAIEKGAAIADVIIQGQRANAKLTALYPAPANVPFIAANNIRTALSVATIAATGIQGAKNITGGGTGGGGSVQPPNIRGSQTTNEPTSQPATKVFVTETDIRSVTRKVDGIFTQATIQ